MNDFILALAERWRPIWLGAVSGIQRGELLWPWGTAATQRWPARCLGSSRPGADIQQTAEKLAGNLS